LDSRVTVTLEQLLDPVDVVDVVDDGHGCQPPDVMLIVPPGAADAGDTDTPLTGVVVVVVAPVGAAVVVVAPVGLVVVVAPVGLVVVVVD
jgi:hypothetical protein